MLLLASASTFLTAATLVGASFHHNVPPPPPIEPIEVIELPLPPVSPDEIAGSCSEEINPRRTGCIQRIGGGTAGNYHGVMGSGDFLPDSKHIISMLTFTGAPAAPDPASIYTGSQIVLVKTDGEVFPNGDTWKCLTCGMPQNRNHSGTYDLSYPQSFDDNRRILAGQNVFDCGEHDLTSPKCSPDTISVYTIRFNTSPDGEGESGSIRELRIHPDNVHLGFSAFDTSGEQISQSAYFGRLEFNPSANTGLPSGPRYDLKNVTIMRDPNGVQPVSVDVSSGQLILSEDAITVGELRGFSQRGDKAHYVGSPRESGNTDAFEVSLATGEIHRLTSHPEYVDPLDSSPDDEWLVILDTRATTRHMFIAGMRNVPPITDLVTILVTTGVRNNGARRFFQPYLLDKYGDRDEYGYYGQKMNGLGNGVPGSGDIDDPEWNTLSDPRWSPDGTMVNYWQAQTISPACGGENPLPCYNSTAPGGRTYRLMLAKLVSREPLDLPPVEVVSDDVITWGIPYVPGVEVPRPTIPVGEYTLEGKVSGYANVSLIASENGVSIGAVNVVYNNYSYDGNLTLNGWENVTTQSISQFRQRVAWYSNMTQTGSDGYLATKKTDSDGFHIELDIMFNQLDINGTLVTTINGEEYYSPQTGT